MAPRASTITRLNQALRESNVGLEVEIGVAKVYERAKPGVKYSADYRGIGSTTYKRIRGRLAGLLCRGGKLKAGVSEITSGEGRQLAVAVLSLLSSQHRHRAGIAIPTGSTLGEAGSRPEFARSPCRGHQRFQNRQPRSPGIRKIALAGGHLTSACCGRPRSRLNAFGADAAAAEAQSR